MLRISDRLLNKRLITWDSMQEGGRSENLSSFYLAVKDRVASRVSICNAISRAHSHLE